MADSQNPPHQNPAMGYPRQMPPQSTPNMQFQPQPHPGMVNPQGGPYKPFPAPGNNFPGAQPPFNNQMLPGQQYPPGSSASVPPPSQPPYMRPPGPPVSAYGMPQNNFVGPPGAQPPRSMAAPPGPPNSSIQASQMNGVSGMGQGAPPVSYSASPSQMMNGPPTLAGMRPPASSAPPLPGGTHTPPMQNMGGRMPHSQQVPPPPPMTGAPTSQPQASGPPPPHSSAPQGRPGELPVPFQGHAQYSHQLHDNRFSGQTPGSGPPSQRSSRAPSPIPGTNYDAMEGQFSPMSPAGEMSQAPPTQQPSGPSQTSKDISKPGGITGRRHYPQMPGTYGGGVSTAPSMPPQQSAAPPNFPGAGGYPGGAMTTAPSFPQPGYPGMPQNMPNQQLNSTFSNMKLTPDNMRPVNLLQERQLIPPEGVSAPKINLPNEFKKVNCHSECTLNSIPNTQSLLNKSRLPLGILIHPFKDLAQLPVIQSSVIVRCRTCRTYINPFIAFVDMRRWKCNLCYRVNELPEEFNYDPVSKTYGEPQRRPEIQSATIEFIAPSEYMLRPPQPAVYLYVLDVSFNAVGTGYLQVFCQTLLEELDRIPGDARTQIGFIAFDRSLHFFNLSDGLSQPQMLVVSDVEDIFLPRPDNLLVNLHESKDLITDLLNKLPSMFEGNTETGSALGPALQAAYKLMSATGGRVTVCQTQLPSVGPGALKCREDPNERAGKKVPHLGPATDFYKKLALDCSAQQIAVDLFLLNAQYADVATVAGISKYSGGWIQYFPGFHTVSNPAEADRFEGSLRRYFTRKIGFEAVMRIRCTRGLSIHTFHGNFFVRSTDLLSLPNINPDAGFGMQMSIEDNLECQQVCFQAALLYTSSKGERRIRVHTLCLPVTNALSEVYSTSDQQAIVGLLSKMAVDKSLSQSMGDARDAMINAAVDMLGAYGNTLTASQRMGQLPCPYSLRLMPLYILALTKSIGFRVGSSTKLDDRVFSLEECKSLPLSLLILRLYPNLYPVHALDDNNALSKGDRVISQPGLLQLTSANIDRHGAYLLDAGTSMFLWLGAALSDRFCMEVFGRPNFASLPEVTTELPELENPTSDRLRTFIAYLQDQRPCQAGLTVLREDSRNRHLFIQQLVEDRTESTHSYYEFLQHLQKEVKT